MKHWLELNRKKRSIIRLITYPSIILGIVVLSVLVYFRYLGLPGQIGDTISHELDRRGLEVSYDLLYLDLLGGVIAKNLNVSYELDGVENTLEVERLRFSFNWISWIQGGKSFIDSASISSADLNIPLDEETDVSLKNVNARMSLEGNILRVEHLSAEILNLLITMGGEVEIISAPDRKPVKSDRSKQAKAWRDVEKYAAFVKGDTPIQVDLRFYLKTDEPELGNYQMRVNSRDQFYKKMPIRSMDIEASFRESRLMVGGDVGLGRGQIRLHGSWTHGTRHGAVNVFSDADLSMMASAFPGKAEEVLSRFEFKKLPVIEAKAQMNWEKEFTFHFLGKISMDEFLLDGQKFQSVKVPLSFDGKRLLVANGKIAREKEKATFDLYYDQTADPVSVKGRVESSLNPGAFRGLFGGGSKAFFDSIQFNKGPKAFVEIEGSSLKPEDIKLSGSIASGPFVYKGVDIDELEAVFEYQDGEIYLPSAKFKRPEGSAQAHVRHNFKTKQLNIYHAEADTQLQQTGLIFSSKLHEYVQPYRFYKEPKLRIKGTLDLMTQTKTDLQVHLISDEGMDYKFLGKDISFSRLDTRMNFKGKRLSIDILKPMRLFDGSVNGNLVVMLTEDPSYTANLTVKGQSFNKLMTTYFDNRAVSGSLDGSINIKGKINDMSSIEAWGEGTISNGTLYDIPIFGGLSDILNDIVPNLGYTKADRARSTFRMRGGVITMEKIDVHSSTFALIGNGNYNYIKDDVDMNMRVNVRGVIGIITFPFSKAFEHRGTGSLADTKWEPKTF